MSKTVLQSLNSALGEMLEVDSQVVLMGEDIVDPYGGAFKVTRGLSTAWPERVISTPISEAGFTGIAAGMAMRGMRPIVEIMFGDFLMLAADQLLNHIAKYRWMYNDQVSVPLTIRTPMGGGRGYGPTHSQSLEKHFIGMPGLRVVAPSPYHNPGKLLQHCVLEDDQPVLFVENKLMYSRRLQVPEGGRIAQLYAETSSGACPTTTLSFAPLGQADVTVVAYGGMAEAAVAAAKKLLLEEELVCDVIVPSSLQPLDLEPIVQSLSRSGHLVCCEEGTRTGGWGAEVISQVIDFDFNLLRSAPVRVAAMDIPIGNTRNLEQAVLPDWQDIVSAVRQQLQASPPAPLAVAV